MLRAQSCDGIAIQSLLKEYWDRVREEFGDLGEQEQARRIDIAAQARAIAHTHRTKAARDLALTDAAPSSHLAPTDAPAHGSNHEGRLRARGECECCRPDKLPHLAGLPIDTGLEAG